MASPRTSAGQVEFEDVAFALPGDGWHRSALPRGVQVVRAYGERRSVGLAVWVVDVPESLRGLTPAEHAAHYFSVERRGHSEPLQWSGFVEGVREVAGIAYPAMMARFTSPDDRRQGDALFLLHFPDDFDERQRFYVLLWSDVRPPGTPARDLHELDAIVRTLRIRPIELIV
jgi:hypothetical protein